MADETPVITPKKYRLMRNGQTVNVVEGAQFIQDGMGSRILNNDGGVVFSTTDHAYTVLEITATLPVEDYPDPVQPDNSAADDTAAETE